MTKPLEYLVGATRALADSMEWVATPKHERMLLSYLKKGTRNSYIARALVAIARNEALQNGNSPITVEEAIDRIESDRIMGVFYICENGLNTSKLSGGGALRCLFYKGEQKSLPIYFLTNYGISAGAPGAVIYDGRTRFILFGPESLNGLDVTQKSFDKLADGMATGLDEQGPRYLPFAGEIVKAWRGLVGEAFFVKEPIMEAVQRAFGSAKMGDGYRLRIGVSNLSTGERTILSSENGHRDVLMYEAIEQSASFPIALSPFRKDGVIAADGGLNVLPIRIAAEEGADLIYVTVLNLHIPKVEKIDGRSPMGTVRMAYRMYEILQSDATREALHQETNCSPEYLREHGDPHGRFLVAVPDLSEYPPFKLTDKYQQIEPTGRAETQRVFSLLDPSRKQAHYRSDYFTEMLRLQKKFGPSFSLMMEGPFK